jgi:hypothetical protein
MSENEALSGDVQWSKNPARDIPWRLPDPPIPTVTALARVYRELVATELPDDLTHSIMLQVSEFLIKDGICLRPEDSE